MPVKVMVKVNAKVELLDKGRTRVQAIFIIFGHIKPFKQYGRTKI